MPVQNDGWNSCAYCDVALPIFERRSSSKSSRNLLISDGDVSPSCLPLPTGARLYDQTSSRALCGRTRHEAVGGRVAVWVRPPVVLKLFPRWFIQTRLWTRKLRDDFPCCCYWKGGETRDEIINKTKFPSITQGAVCMTLQQVCRKWRKWRKWRCGDLPIFQQ